MAVWTANMALAAQPNGSSAEGVPEAVLSLLDAVDIEIRRPQGSPSGPPSAAPRPTDVPDPADRCCSLCVKQGSFPCGGRDLLRLALRAVPKFLSGTELLDLDQLRAVILDRLPKCRSWTELAGAVGTILEQLLLCRWMQCSGRLEATSQAAGVLASYEWATALLRSRRARRYLRR